MRSTGNISELLGQIDVLRGRVQHLEEELAEARSSHDETRVHAESLAFLAQSSMKLLELTEQDELFRFIAQQLEGFAPTSIVVVSSFDPGTRLFTTREVCGLGSMAEKISSILGRSIVGMTFPITDFGYNELRSHRVALVERGIFELSAERVPRSVCLVVERLLKLGPIYSMGFCWNDELFGAASVLTRKGGGSVQTDVFRTFVSQASVVLQRRRIEREKASLEARLHHVQKMESLGSLAGGVAHDFNNLLMCIEGHLFETREAVAAGADTRGHLESIEELVQSGARLSRQLLGLAQVGTYDSKTEDITALVGATLDLFSRAHRDLTIDADLDHDGCLAEVDAGQIEQVLLNLFINAAQAMEGVGTLAVSCRVARLDGSEAAQLDLAAGQFVVTSVRDMGAGIPPELVPRVFDPFFTTKEVGKGTGLGLASAYGIVRRHGGAVELSSVLGEGTTFTLYLPSSPVGPKAEVPLTTDDLYEGTGTILVVDDEPQILRATSRYLERLGYDVLTARGGSEAVEIVRRNGDALRLVILDMIMPEMSGAMVLVEIRKIQPALKVLISTGYSADAQDAAAISSLAEGIIHKPFTVAQLSKKLKEILEPRPA